MQQIVFTDTKGIPKEFYPKPATASIPEWYKGLTSYLTESKRPNGQGKAESTIKKCMPVFDAMTGGYVLYTYVDVYVSQQEIAYKDEKHFQETGEEKFLTKAQIKKNKLTFTQPYYEWSNFEPIMFHPNAQAPTIPAGLTKPNHVSYPKWINPWAIQTPKGYSTFFTQPMHRESPFTILDGIVDTDNYTAPVNFPFVLNDWGFEGLIPAGTPMAQVIPFKRESWKMRLGDDKDRQSQANTTTHLLSSFFDSYKNKFRQPKEYK
jgi:hypothetical protein